MAKHSDPLEEIQGKLTKRLEQIDPEIGQLKAEIEKKRREKIGIRKALKAVGGSERGISDALTSPTFQHLEQALPAAFQDHVRLSTDQLTSRLAKILKAQPTLSEQGLGLRISQFVTRLEKDASGLVLNPRAAKPQEVNG